VGGECATSGSIASVGLCTHTRRTHAQTTARTHTPFGLLARRLLLPLAEGAGPGDAHGVKPSLPPEAGAAVCVCDWFLGCVCGRENGVVCGFALLLSWAPVAAIPRANPTLPPTDTHPQTHASPPTDIHRHTRTPTPTHRTSRSRMGWGWGWGGGGGEGSPVEEKARNDGPSPSSSALL
jgi:hypothetical protein